MHQVLWLRPDIIKLDRCIVTAIDQDPALRRALAAVMASFAASLDMTVVGEGAGRHWRISPARSPYAG